MKRCVRVIDYKFNRNTGGDYKTISDTKVIVDSMKEARELCGVPLHYNRFRHHWEGYYHDWGVGSGTEWIVSKEER